MVPASLQVAALKGDEVRISYVGHATFLIESPQGVKIATDYNDYVKPRVIPDIATMNHAHSTHYTDNPDPAIKHVLRGWGPTPRNPPGMTSLSATSASATSRLTSATTSPAPPRSTATRSLCSRSPDCASPTWATCTTP